MAIGAVKKGVSSNFYIYDEKGRQIATITTGFMQSELVNWTATTVTIKVLNTLKMYDEKGKFIRDIHWYGKFYKGF